MKEIIINILKDSSTRIDVDTENRVISLEANLNGLHVLLEDSKIDGEWDLEIHFKESTFRLNKEQKECVEAWIHSYAENEVNNTTEAFNHQDRVDQNNLIYNN